MDDKLNELKEKQASIGNKISHLQQTNKKKDEEAAEIRQLIAECKENLKRIKGTTSKAMVSPCADFDTEDDAAPKSDLRQLNPEDGKESGKNAPSWLAHRLADKILCGKGDKKDDKNKKPRCEKVTCKVDLNKMKVRIRGPSEDLKKLNATELINLLEKFQCQELIINTGEEVPQDPGEIRMVYLLHPGNIVMAAGIILVAFLFHANIHAPKEHTRTEFLLNSLYLSSLAFHYGMVLWMTFIRGYALKCGLSRDTFNVVDNVILPKYFSVCALLSAITLYSFLATHCAYPCTSWPLQILAQLMVNVVTFMTELIMICYIVPAIIKLRDATDECLVDDEDPENPLPENYEKNLIKLSKMKCTICLVNLLTLIFLGVNMYHLTNKLIFGK